MADNPWTTRTTTDHERIREWARARDAAPAHVEATGDDDVGVLRLDFPEVQEDANLEAVSWDEFFEKFDRENLAFRYQNEKKSGEQSNFHRFVQREETGVADVPDADVSVVAVGSAPVADAEADEPASMPVGEESLSESGPSAGTGSGVDVTDADAAPEEGEFIAGEGGESARERASATESGASTSEAPSETADSEPEMERAAGLTVGLVVDEIHEDAFGYDHWNRNDEYLVFRNDGEEPLELGEWTVQNEDDHTYEFPAEFVLEPNRAVTLHSGEGSDTDDHLYWNSERAIWKNTGDVLTVRDDAGRQVVRESY